MKLETSTYQFQHNFKRLHLGANPAAGGADLPK